MIRREAQIQEALMRALGELGIEVESSAISVEVPAREEHGDFSSNVALVHAKTLSIPPRALAEKLSNAPTLRQSVPFLDHIAIAGPGFLNFYLTPSHLHELIGQVISEGEVAFACSDLGASKRVLVEFVSANPTGPLHIGNGWWASYGDALARVLRRSGFGVSTEYYVNDTGGQIRTLGASILARRAGEAPPEGGYQGEYVVEQAERYQGSEDVTEAGRWAAKENLAYISSSLDRLGVHFDEWYSQASIEESGAVAEVVDRLKSLGGVYERDDALWLESTKFGDNRDRVLRKSNGDFTYLAGDIAYHYNKLAVRAFDIAIDIFGADHHGQVASLKAAMAALGIDPDRLEIRLGQMVSLTEGNEVVKFSKRAGTAIALDWLLDELGAGVTRILSLSSSIDRASTIDLEEAKATSMENPAYYVQYAYARMRSLERMRVERGIELREYAAIDMSGISHPRELRLMREIVSLPEVVANAALERAPHKLVTWLKSVAGAFHGFYHDCPVLAPGTDTSLVQGRLKLVEGARIAMKVGLDLVGVDAPEEM
ncbi:MAG: arginine--tRNA ligase [Acidimicrobiales bacterium]